MTKMSVIITCSWSRPSGRVYLALTTWAHQSFIVVGEWMRNSQICSLRKNSPFPRYWRCRRAPVTTMCTFARLQAVFRLFSSANPAWFQKVVYTSILVLPLAMVWVSESFYFLFFILIINFIYNFNN